MRRPARAGVEDIGWCPIVRAERVAREGLLLQTPSLLAMQKTDVLVVCIAATPTPQVPLDFADAGLWVPCGAAATGDAAGTQGLAQLYGTARADRA